ncbi:MAG: amidohydrolase family protein [Planctomycetaceae bacterium]
MTALRTVVCLLSLSLFSVASASDEIPGAPQRRPIALVNVTIHTVSGPIIENGTLVFSKGMITDVGRDVSPPEKSRIIDLGGRHVYPGLIEAHSQIGLTEIAAVRATRDTSETGSFNPNVKAHVSVNPDSEVIPVTRANGVLIALSAPSGGRISGQASVMQLDGWTFEDMTLKPSAAMIVHWPSPPRSGPNEQLKELRRFFDDARAYEAARLANSGPNGQAFDIRLESLLPVLHQEVPLMAHAGDAREIQTAVAFAAEQNVKLIIFGGHDALACAELLTQYQVPVVIDSVHRTPARRHEDYDAPYSLAARLKDAGIAFCISGSERESTWNTRNLPYHAATAAAYGLDRDEALKAVTLYPARILGIDDRVGSLEVGKDATLIVTNGDPLETETEISRAWIRGRRVDLGSRHKSLYEKYSRKYAQAARQQ